MTSFALNGKPVEVDVDPATPLLWVRRDSLGLTGTGFDGHSVSQDCMAAAGEM